MDKIQVLTAISKHKNKAIMERLDKLMDIIDDKMEEVTAYKSRKKEKAQVRLQEVGDQAKAAGITN